MIRTVHSNYKVQLLIPLTLKSFLIFLKKYVIIFIENKKGNKKMLNDFLTQIQSDEFAWRYEENEEEIRYEDFQEESGRTSTVSNIQKTWIES